MPCTDGDAHPATPQSINSRRHRTEGLRGPRESAQAPAPSRSRARTAAPYTRSRLTAEEVTPTEVFSTLAWQGREPQRGPGLRTCECAPQRCSCGRSARQREARLLHRFLHRPQANTTPCRRTSALLRSAESPTMHQLEQCCKQHRRTLPKKSWGCSHPRRHRQPVPSARRHHHHHQHKHALRRDEHALRCSRRPRR